jgi:hypothetical protein
MTNNEFHHKLRKILLTDLTELLVNCAVLIAVKSREKHRISCLNLAPLIRERKEYLFLACLLGS